MLKNQNIRLTRKERVKYLKMIHFYRRHPVLAVRDILGLPVSSPHLRIAIRAAWFCDHCILVLSRGMMKSTINAIISTLKSILYPNRTQLVLGPQFRQGRMIFEDAGIEKILMDRMGHQVHRKGFGNYSCTTRTKIIQRGLNDLWKVQFKNGSKIITGPLGKKGDSLLGIRANDIRLDEMRDFTKYQVTKVIHPFANVMSDPFSNLEDSGSFMGNTFMYGGTIRYTDDYYYEIIEEYRKRMRDDSEIKEYGFSPLLSRGKYAVVEFNYEDSFRLSPGTRRPSKFSVEEVTRLTDQGKIKFYFRINLEEIEEGRDSDTISIEDWLAENKNFPIKLGSKEFPYLLLQSVSDEIEFEDPNIPNSQLLFPEALSQLQEGFIRSKDFVANLEPLLKCDQVTVMGVDVATESDKFAITIIRPGTVLGNSFDHIVYAFARSHMSYSDMIQKIYECVENYNVVLIHMDKRGGGTALRDMLREPEDKTRLALVDEKTDPKAFTPERRADILRMVNASAEYNTQHVNLIKSKFQAKKLLMPRIVTIHPVPEMDTVYHDLYALRGQFGKVKSKNIGGGWRKYYIPESKSSDESLEKGFKDLFSSTVYAISALVEYCESISGVKKTNNFTNFPVPKYVPIGEVIR